MYIIHDKIIALENKSLYIQSVNKSLSERKNCQPEDNPTKTTIVLSSPANLSTRVPQQRAIQTTGGETITITTATTAESTLTETTDVEKRIETKFNLEYHPNRFMNTKFVFYNR